MSELPHFDLPSEPDEIAPDGSEIRFIERTDEYSRVHCTLPARGVSKAVTHKTITESWQFLSGEGEVMLRKKGEEPQIFQVKPNSKITIPPQTDFQFRSTSEESLTIIITTTPPWPGPEEAIEVQDYWERKD